MAPWVKTVSVHRIVSYLSFSYFPWLHRWFLFCTFAQAPFVSLTWARPRLLPPLIPQLWSPLPPPLQSSPLPPLETTPSMWTARLVCSPLSGWGSVSSWEMYACQSRDPQVIRHSRFWSFDCLFSSVLLWNRNTRSWTWTLMSLLCLDPAELTKVCWCWCRTQWTSHLLSSTWVRSYLYIGIRNHIHSF